MDRFNGYNRSDYYFPNTSREAFGSGWQPEKEMTKWEVVKGLVLYAAIVYALVVLQGILI